ncbi:MAG TPA: zinc-binding alcohol dehydrogenase family protein [Microlunatus sp.]|nr:zinc-binding alcohol dehydrogenase family protein [Microlunatus sp.]
MRAALITGYGTPPVLGQRPDPDQAVNVVQVTAAPIVPLDVLCASGTSYFGQHPLPYVPGVQGVGVVRSSPELSPGRRVWFATTAGMQPGDGSLAELCAATTEDLVPIDADLPDTAAAAIGTSGIAAWMALTWRARLEPGERVVVLGASGVVGQVALAAARSLGAGRIVACVRSAPAAEAAVVAGADDVVVLSDADGRASVTARLREAAGGPVDVVIDPVFGEPAAAAAEALGPGGRLVNLGGAAGDRTDFSSAALRGRTISVLGYTNNAITTAQRAGALDAVLGLAADGKLSVDHDVRALSDCTAAWEAATRSGRRIVVDPRA